MQQYEIDSMGKHYLNIYDEALEINIVNKLK